ncbi:tripartite tricarboxylate transporter substrate-binding protein [Alkalibacillus silvisoli]|uniref:Tripartite tricarboxylate transporter substrate binding protein n=1 Tax=Alkalibacillus silvisoli TaxID=392823 RepID=A0ABP3JX50_9BACI
MKRILVGSLFAFMLLILAACGGDDQAADEGSNNDEAQDWEPEESIELVAPAGAGGGWDTTARMAAQTLTEEGIIEQDIGVVNQPGAGGAVGWAHIANQDDSPYDLFVSSSPLLLVPLNGQSDYNYEDFTPIANIIAEYATFAVRDDAEWEDLNDLFDDMKENPSEITVVGTSSPGSMDHIQFVRFAREAGVDITQINYVSDPDAGGVTQLLNGSADVFSTGIGQVLEQIRSGDIRPLAITSEERLEGEVLSEIPTAIEQGIDETFVNWRGIFGTGDMDQAAVDYYEEKFKELSDSEAFAEVRDNYSWDEMFMGSEEYLEFLEEENEVFKEILDELDLSDE